MFRMIFLVLLALVPASLSTRLPHPALDARASPAVVLLHGLARSNRSMVRLQAALSQRGYFTCNVDYPSRRHDIGALVREHVLPAIEACVIDRTAALNFVTHSMGGVLVRYIAAHQLLEPIGRVVMLAPPNGGSEVVDRLGRWPLFEWINGPAGLQLGTDGLPSALGPATFELGVLAGNRSINWWLSSLIDGVDDGKVSVQRTRLAGMADFRVLPATHTLIMNHPQVIAQTVHFLQRGQFSTQANQASR